MRRPLQNLEQLLDHLVKLAEGEAEVSLGMVVESIGSRAFGPLLMLIGLTLVSPFSGIPGMAVTMAIFVGLIASPLQPTSSISAASPTSAPQRLRTFDSRGTRCKNRSFQARWPYLGIPFTPNWCIFR
jgi:hypothetical protein